MKVYNYEVYLSNPKTGENGFRIEMVSVIAEKKDQVQKILERNVPNFDKIITLNWFSDLSAKDMWRERDCFESGLRVFFTHNNLPASIRAKE